MRQDWIEFKGKLLSDGQYNFSLRPEYIVAIDGKEGKAMTEIQYDTGSDQLTYYATEPYRQVKQKIMDAEKYDLNDVVVEHFTDDEYVTLFVMVLAALGKSDESNNDEGLISIKNKLSKIIEKNK